MQICKNCNSQNNNDAKVCSRCKMPGMLIKDNTISLTLKIAEANMSLCKNCKGSIQEGDIKCKKCNFPISIQSPSVSTLPITKENL